MHPGKYKHCKDRSSGTPQTFGYLCLVCNFFASRYIVARRRRRERRVKHVPATCSGRSALRPESQLAHIILLKEAKRDSPLSAKRDKSKEKPTEATDCASPDQISDDKERKKKENLRDEILQFRRQHMRACKLTSPWSPRRPDEPQSG